MRRFAIGLVPALWLVTFSLGFSGDDATKKPAVPLYEGLGNHTRPVTKHAEAQKYFHQGLAFLFAFNHDEAIRSFHHAATLDPDCAMAFWGLALANGPHINKPVLPPDRAKAAWAALQQAKSKAKSASDVNQALITALAERYADPAPEDRAKLDQAYAAAMKGVWQLYPNDADVGALTAEAIMDLRPWDLWTHDGKPQPETPEVLKTLEAVQKLNPHHPLALHLYIHAVEASPEPGRATEVADRLRHLQPGLGHMVHMPSHIDVRTGRWQDAVEANERAIRADDAYRKLSPKQDFYRIYMMHNHHMLGFAAMMRGQSKVSLDAITTMLGMVPKDWLDVPENAAMADGFTVAPLKVMVRFGMWDRILQASEPEARFPVARAFWHHARGIAFAAKGDTTAARDELAKLREAMKATPKEAFFGNNSAEHLFAVAEPMLEGEILAHEGKLDDGIAKLKLAVEKELQLRYDEPPDWIVPVRHALGAFLLKAKKPAEAEAVYRADLKMWPNNGWSLFGLAESLDAQGKTAEAAPVREQWKKVWANADIPLKASCLCAISAK